MKARVAGAALAAARALPNAAYRRLIVHRGFGLCYHVVSDRPRPHVPHAFKSPEQFARDLVYLRRHFRVLSYAEFSAARAAGTGPGPRDLLLTFDDGLAECYTVVRPLLLKHGLPCTFFVATDALDNRKMLGSSLVPLALERLRALGDAAAAALDREADALGHRPDTPAGWAAWIHGLRFAGRTPGLDRACELLGVDEAGYLAGERPYLSTEQLRTMAAEGFTIGGHTRAHRLVRHLSPGEMESEVAGSCAIVREITGDAEIPFAFPFTGKGVELARLDALRKRHPHLGLFFGMGLRRSPRYVVDRAWADPPRPAAAGSSIPANLSTEYAAQAVAAVAGLVRGRKQATTL